MSRRTARPLTRVLLGALVGVVLWSGQPFGPTLAVAAKPSKSPIAKLSPKYLAPMPRGKNASRFLPPPKGARRVTAGGSPKTLPVLPRPSAASGGHATPSPKVSPSSIRQTTTAPSTAASPSTSPPPPAEPTPSTPATPRSSSLATPGSPTVTSNAPQTEVSGIRTLSASPPTLTESVSPGGATYAVGMALSITLTVNNPAGGSDLSVTGLTDSLPSSLSGAGTSISFNGQACSAAGVSCTESANLIAIGPFSVLSGQSATIAFNAVAVGSPSNCGSTTNSASANTSAGTLQASSTLSICDTALGLEKWWSYAGQDLGGGQTGKLNVADGNLVISSVDSTPIQAHGQLVYDLLRTYNSQDSGLVSFPGQLAQSWTLSVGGAGDASGTSAGEVGLYVPPAESVAAPLAVTLIGRNGERHVLQPVLPQPTPIDVTSAVSGDLAAVNPKVVTSSAGNHLCVDTLYQASAGIHLSVWRYIGVTSSAATNPCGNPDASTTPTVAGFAIERPDRIRYEFG